MLQVICLLAVSSYSASEIEKIGPTQVQIVTKESVERLPDPRNVGQLLDASVQYRVEGQVVAQRIEENIVARTYNLRTGMPPTQFVLDGLLAAPPNSTIQLDEIEKIEVMLDSLPARFGMSPIANMLNVAQKTVSEEVAKRSVRFNPSDGVREGGWTLRDYAFDRQSFNLSYNLMRDVTWQASGERTSQSVGQFNVPLGDWYLPRKMPILDRFMADADAFKGAEEERITYRVGGIEFTDEYEGKLQLSGITLPWRDFQRKTYGAVNYDTYLRDVSNQYGSQFTSNLLLRSGLGPNDVRRMMDAAAPRGEDMNALYFPGDPKALGPVDCGSSIHFPPGTSMYPDDAAYQGVSSFNRFKYRFPPLFAGPGFIQPEQKEILINCLNIEQKEPAKNVKYFPYYCTDPVIRGLMELASKARFQGPWIQARTWIYTDHASLADINKRMFPPVSKARYVNALYEIARLGGFADKELSDAKIFDPALLSCVFADDEAIGWFIWTMERKHAKATRAWLERNPKELTDLVASDKADDVAHVALVVDMLCASPNADIRLGGLGFLSSLRTKPEALKGKLTLPILSLASEDEKEVLLALSCVERYFDKMPKRPLDALANFGKTDGIKKKAAELRDK